MSKENHKKHMEWKKAGRDKGVKKGAREEASDIGRKCDRRELEARLWGKLKMSQDFLEITTFNGSVCIKHHMKSDDILIMLSTIKQNRESTIASVW